MAGKQHNITVDVNDILYYVDYAHIDVYVNKNDKKDIKIGKDEIALNNPDIYQFDETLTQAQFDKFKQEFINAMQQQHKSLKTTDKTVKGVHHLLENDMFIVAMEDNNWSVGVELLNKPKYENENLREHVLPNFATNMRNILLDLIGEIHIRTGSWTTEIITKKQNANNTATAPVKTQS